MSPLTPRMRDLAERVIAYEATDFLVIEKLRSELSTLMGNMGSGAVLLRAQALASTEVPWLRDVRIQTNGSAEEFDEIGARLAPPEFFEGKVVLLAHLLELLRAFIGESLTLRLVLEVWPKLTLDNPDSGIGEKHEE